MGGSGGSGLARRVRWRTHPVGGDRADRIRPCWRYGRTRAPGSRESLPARSLGLSAREAVVRSRSRRCSEALSYFYQILLTNTQELTGQVHQALFVQSDGAIAKGYGPHAFNEG